MPKTKSGAEQVKSQKAKAARVAKKERDKKTLKNMRERDTDASGKLVG